MGRGNHGVEALNLNPMADPRDPEANYAVFAETLEILKRALSQETFSFRGDKYVFPTPGFTWDRAHPVDDPDYIDRDTGEVTRLSLMPRSIQQPHPPLWQMVDSTRSIEFGARNGLGVIMWRPPVAKARGALHALPRDGGGSGTRAPPRGGLRSHAGHLRSRVPGVKRSGSRATS